MTGRERLGDSPITIESRGTLLHRPLGGVKESAWFAVLIFCIALLKQVPDLLLHGHFMPGPWDIDMACAVAVAGFFVWILLPLFFRKERVVKLELTGEGVALYPEKGERRFFRWDDIDAAGWDRAKTEIALASGKERAFIGSRGFDERQWQQVMSAFGECLPAGTCHMDLGDDFSRKLCQGLEHLTLPTIVTGILMTAYFLAIDSLNGTIIAGGAAVALIIIYTVLQDYFGTRLSDQPVLNLLIFFRFWGLKLFALVPLAIIFLFILSPTAEPIRVHVCKDWLYYAANCMFFGGLAFIIIIGEGVSFSQFRRSECRGVNLLLTHLINGALVICIAGFLLKLMYGR